MMIMMIMLIMKIMMMMIIIRILMIISPLERIISLTAERLRDVLARGASVLV